jgi:type II secretory pathway component PulM
MPRHTPECSVGQEHHRRSQVFREVQAAIAKAVQEKYRDTEFMDRLHRNIARHGVLLNRLAEGDES